MAAYFIQDGCISLSVKWKEKEKKTKKKKNLLQCGCGNREQKHVIFLVTYKRLASEFGIILLFVSKVV